MKAVAAVITIVMVIVLAFGALTNGSSDAAADDVNVPRVTVTVTAPPDLKGCLVNLNDGLGVVICGGEVVDEIPLPTVTALPTVIPTRLPTVTLPPITVTDIVRVPGPVRTVTIPGPTETVQIPGPTQTATESVTQPPGTATATATVTRQVEVDDGTIEPDMPDTVVERITKFGLGLLGTLAILGFILAVLWFGYIRGWMSAKKNEERSLRNLLNFAKQGKHR